jgi:hypothetical protein
LVVKNASQKTNRRSEVAMGRIVIAAGSRGELVERLQRALVEFGFPQDGVDGAFGAATKTALIGYQKLHGFTPSGDADDETCQALIGDVPDVHERALGVTAAFEGHGYSLAQGNFDGAGITWGIIGFTLGNGELGSILNELEQRNPETLLTAFGDKTDELLDVLTRLRTQQIAWADQISLGKSKARLAQPWRDAFARLGSDSNVQALQREHVNTDYFEPARQTATDYELSTELGIALAFDIHVQNGGIKVAAAADIHNHLAEHPIATEQERRVIIASAVADNARPQYRDDVRARKLTLAVGTGKVHDKLYVLRNWGLDDVPAA